MNFTFRQDHQWRLRWGESISLYGHYNVLHFVKRKRGGRPGCRGPEEMSSTFTTAATGWARRSCDWRVDAAAGSESWRNIVLHLRKTQDYSSSPGPGGTGWRGEQARRGTQGGNSRRAPDSLLEGNTYYRFWDETGRVIPVQIMTNV